MDRIKKIKVKKQDGTFSDYIPIGADAENIDTTDGESVEVKLNKKPYYYNNVADMKADTKLKAGDMAITLGYYESNDGGGAEYKIVNNSENYYEELNNNLKAELIIENASINTKQFGAIGDGQTDDTDKIQKLFDYVSKENKGIRIIVNGMHLVNNGLIIKGTNDKLLSNIVITGLNGSRNYGNNKSLINGFKFVADYTTTQSAFDNTTGILFDYCYSPVIEYLNITSTETVANGDIPLNNTTAIKLKHSNGSRITHCNITNVFRGILLENCGLAEINDNNVSLCNIGIETFQSGDNSLIDNYINTCGWDIREKTDGKVKSKFSAISKINRVFGLALYIGDGGNTNVRGGKIEWCNEGIWQDYATNMIYEGIQFDRCSSSAIAITGHNNLINRTLITNNNFTGCSGITPKSANYDNIGGLAGHVIGCNQSHGILITNNKFYGDNGALHGSLKTTNSYYGPSRSSIFFDSVYESAISNNIINYDGTYACDLINAIVLFDNNVTNLPTYINPNTIVYKQAINRKEFYTINPNGYTIGNFDVNDIIINLNTLQQKWRVTTAGTKKSIDINASVVTEESIYYPGDKTVLDFGTTYNKGILPGAYINIEGVSGTKKIIDVIRVNSHCYAKLNSACDVAVSNAKVTNQEPTFTEI